MSDRILSEWSDYVLYIPFILSGSKNNCQLHMCCACIIIVFCKMIIFWSALETCVKRNQN